MSSRALLLVDADPTVQETLVQALERPGREIALAADGASALARLRAARYDLLVAGHAENGLDGLQLLRRARAVRPDIKAIVTGAPDPRRVVRAIRERAYGYLHLPLAVSSLSEMAQQALETESPWRDEIRVISGRPEWITLDVRCRLEAAERTTLYLRELEADLPPQACDDVAIAFRELLMNAMEHGGSYDPHKRVRVSLLRTAVFLMVHIHDPGAGFSLDSLPHAAISNPADSPTRHIEIRTEHGQRPGGFGILLSRNLVDDLLYNERGNAVMFVKYLKPASAV